MQEEQSKNCKIISKPMNAFVFGSEQQRLSFWWGSVMYRVLHLEVFENSCSELIDTLSSTLNRTNTEEVVNVCSSNRFDCSAFETIRDSCSKLGI